MEEQAPPVGVGNDVSTRGNMKGFVQATLRVSAAQCPSITFRPIVMDHGEE